MIALRLYDTRFALILFHTAFQTGFCTLFMRNFIRELPDPLLDAARIDGAGELRIFWSVVLPLVRPAMAAVAVLVFTFVWNDYFWSLVLVQSDASARHRRAAVAARDVADVLEPGRGGLAACRRAAGGRLLPDATPPDRRPHLRGSGRALASLPSKRDLAGGRAVLQAFGMASGCRLREERRHCECCRGRPPAVRPGEAGARMGSPQPIGGPMKSILDPTFRYVPSTSTDVRKTFSRIRREMQKAGAAGIRPPGSDESRRAALLAGEGSRLRTLVPPRHRGGGAMRDWPRQSGGGTQSC